MSKRKNDAFSEAIVGLFMLAVLALLVYFTIIISGVDVLQGRTKVVATVTFTDVGGLKDHDSIMYRGTKVGAVERIELSPTNLVVRMEIDKSVVLREGYRIAVCNLSMLGGNYLLLEEGEGAALPLETTAFVGEKPSDWMRDVSDIARNLKDFTAGGELKSIVTNLEAASANVKTVTDRIARGEGTLGQLLSTNDTVYADLQRTLANAGEISDRLADGKGTLEGDLIAGEMQRLAIARALIRKPGILVLDEVTNHLDADARAAFGKLLRRLAPGRIVLVVSHDPTLIDLCDEKIFCQIPEKPSYISA